MTKINMHQKRQILRIACGICLAFIIQSFSKTPEFYWMIFATILVMITKRGNAFYQGLIHFFIFIIVVSIGTVIFQHGMFYTRAEAIVIGAIIGIATNLIILPDHFDAEFREIVMSLLDIYDEYFQHIVLCMLDGNKHLIEKTQVRLEKGLLTLPTYIYDPGFDITMRKGHQYFSSRMVQLSEILFSLRHVACHLYDQNIINSARQPLTECAVKVHSFFIALNTVLDLKQLPGKVDDFYSEIAKIEDEFNHIIPLKLESIDLEKQFVFFAMLLRDLKEFHDNLLLLAKTLP